MNRFGQNGASIEATLDDLYANELDVALSWDHERGFWQIAARCADGEAAPNPA